MFWLKEVAESEIRGNIDRQDESSSFIDDEGGLGGFMNRFVSEAPEITVKIAVLNALDEMLHCNLFGTIHVGNGAANLENPVVRPS